MDKKRKRQIQRDARKKAKQLKNCTHAEFNEFVEYLTHKELAIGEKIVKTNSQIKKMESKQVTELQKVSESILGCLAGAGAAAVLSTIGSPNETATFVANVACGAISGGMVGSALPHVSSAVNDIMLHVKRNKLTRLNQEREESEYFVDMLDAELQK